MLAYAHINLLTMLVRLSQAPRIATDSLYLLKEELDKLAAVDAFVPARRAEQQSNLDMLIAELLGEQGIVPESPAVRPATEAQPAQWRDKGERILSWDEHAVYMPEPTHWSGRSDAEDSTALSHNDPIATSRLSYLNGSGGSGKTTRSIKLLRQKNPLVLTPTHRLAKEFRTKEVRAQTYHSFFRWSGQNDWTPDRMGQKIILRVIIWDEICTVPLQHLEVFLPYLEAIGCQVVCCSDQGQPPPIAGPSPHNWLRERCMLSKGQGTHYEEVTMDYRAKDLVLQELKRNMRLETDQKQCKLMRKALPECLGWERFVNRWKPEDLIVSTRKTQRNRAQKLLYEHHKQAFPDRPVPLLYHPRVTRKQNILVTIPGIEERQELVLNAIVEVSIEAAERELARGITQIGALAMP